MVHRQHKSLIPFFLFCPLLLISVKINKSFFFFQALLSLPASSLNVECCLFEDTVAECSLPSVK